MTKFDPYLSILKLINCSRLAVSGHRHTCYGDLNSQEERKKDVRHSEHYVGRFDVFLSANGARHLTVP